MKIAIAYLQTQIATFDTDPPDDEFQRGYLQALKDMLKDLLNTH